MERPLRPDDVRKFVQEIASKPEPSGEDKGLRGAMVGYFNRLMGSENRKLVAGWLFSKPGEEFSPMSFKSDSMTPQQIYALSRWVGLYKDEDLNIWLTHPAWIPEAHSVVGAARYDYHKPEPLSMTDTTIRQFGGIMTVEHEDTEGVKDEDQDVL